MSYVILHRQIGARGMNARWRALPRLADTEHQARDLQKSHEKANPGTETRREWIEFP